MKTVRRENTLRSLSSKIGDILPASHECVLEENYKSAGLNVVGVSR